MKILIVGSGGREHAIAWKVSQSEKRTRYTVRPAMRELPSMRVRGYQGHGI